MAALKGKQTDLTYLFEFSGGDKTFVREMIDLFNKNMPKSCKELNEAYKTRNWIRLHEVSHNMKSSFQFVGAAELQEIAFKIELQAKKEEDANWIGSAIETIEGKVPELFQELHSWPI